MDFKQIELKDYDLFNEYYKKYPQKSAFMSFSTIFLWRSFSGIKFKVTPKGHIILRGVSHHTGMPYFSLPETTDEIFLDEIKLLLEEYKHIHMPHLTHHQYELLIESYGSEIQAEKKEENGNYIYETETLLNLSGKKLQSKRNHINKFKKTYAYEIVDISNSEIAEKCIDMTEKWYKIKDDDDDYLKAELAVCKESIKYINELHLIGSAILVDGEVIAYSIGESMDNGQEAHILIEKAYAEIDGAYAAINNLFINRHWSETKLVNREEDMGLPGLRKAKMSYCPAFLLEMYDVKL